MGNSAARSAVDVGSVIADTYTIEGMIGAGGMGAVFVASHKRLPGKKVAIKILHAELHDDEVLARFRREAEIASRLGHPNIAAVHDFNVTPDGMPYLVLEYLIGETLAQRLKAGPLALDHAFAILRQSGSALAAAHREGIVHRDLKPQNIFLVATEIDGRRAETAKVLDFGISKIRGSSTVQTQEATLLGTPQYMAPEQALGQHTNVDERTDVFALGAIAYEMLSGRPAFAGASIPEVVFKVVYEQPAPLGPLAPGVPAHVVDAIAKAMAKPAAERFPSASAFVEALTGHPLLVDRPAGSSLPPPEVGFASGSRHIANGDAYAKTMGSDHGGKVPSLRVGGDAVSATDATIGPNAAIITNAPTHGGTDRAPATLPDSPRAKRSAGLVVGIAVACAAVAAGVVFFAMRGHGEPSGTNGSAGSAAPIAGVGSAAAGSAAAGSGALGSAAGSGAPQVTASPDAPPAVATAPDAPTAVAMAAPDAAHAAPVDAPAAKAHAPDKGGAPDREPAETGGPGDDPDVAALLTKAQAALDGGNYELAERLANAVITRPGVPPRQRIAARLVHGIVQCAAHNDDEGAMIDLRAMDHFPRFRARLLATCHEHGALLGH